MPEFTFPGGRPSLTRRLDANLFSTCRRADKNMYMKSRSIMKIHLEDEAEERRRWTVGQAVKERAKGQ